MSLSAAKSRVNQAKMQFESNRIDDVEGTIAAGEKFLDGLPDGEAAPVRAEFAALRAQLAALPTSQETRELSAAKGKMRQARSQMADRHLGVEDTLATAERHLAQVRDIHRGDVGEDMARLRAEVSAYLAPVAVPEPARVAPPISPAPAPTPTATPAPALVVAPVAAPVAAPRAADAPLTDDENANLSRGRGCVTAARNDVESRRTENVEYRLEQAAGFLDQVPAHATAALRAQMVEIRQQAVEVDRAEFNRRSRSELDRLLSGARSDVEMQTFDRAAEYLDKVLARAADPDVARGLTADEQTEYRDRVAAGRGELAAAIKADGLDRSAPYLAELEGLVETDPLAGLDQREAYNRMTDVNRLRLRILGAIRRVPDTDPEIRSIHARLTAVEQKVDAASAAWGKAQLDAEVSNNWGMIERDIAGWDAEPDADDVSQLHEPDMPLTRRAIQRIRYLLADAETVTIRRDHAGDPAIEGPYQQAERVLAAAGAKLTAGFNRVLDAAERLETPLNRFILDRPALLAYGAESALAGTHHAEPTAARARALDARWKTEVAAIMRARQALFDQLAAEAETTWPRICDATGAEAFDPATARPGMVVRLDNVYNRSGWDYGSRQYDFSVSSSGTVVAGAYEPYIMKALEHAWYELKLDVSDRFPWDLIGVVEGPGKIGERTTVTLRDARTSQEIGKIEEWPPIDCLKIRIIALHAGPVAVGPG